MGACLYDNIYLKTNVKLYLINELYLMRKWDRIQINTLAEYSLLEWR